MIKRLAIAGFAVTVAACGGARSGAHASTSSVRPVPLADGDLTADQQVTHALHRLTFGARPGSVAQLHAAGLERWIAQQLQPESIPDTLWEHFAGVFTTQSASVKDLVDANPPQDIWIKRLRKARGLPDTGRFVFSAEDSVDWKLVNDRTNRLSGEIVAAPVARSQLSERQLLEVMTAFWENHFSVFAGKMPTRFTVLEYDRDVIRPRALGKFRDLLGAVAHSPAMLYYLDNWQSASDTAHRTLPEWRAAELATAAGKPVPRKGRRGNGLNENFGRELMELHTLGVAGGYSQRDVIEVARALTGWTLQDPREGGGFIFRPEWHDAEPKTVVGHPLAAGRGIEDGEEVLDLLARHPSTARFIATKLVRRFVSDTPPAGLVARVASTFERTDGDIRAVVQAIVTSAEFFSHAAYKSKVKSPRELVVSALRAINAGGDSTPRTAGVIGRLGEPLFGHVTPDGYPDAADAWMNAGAVLDRINFGVNAGSGRIPGASLDRWPPSWTLAFAPLSAQVDGVVALLLDGEASPDTRQILMTGQNPLLALRADTLGAGAMAAPVGTPPSSKLTFAALVGLALGSPEFQRR